MVPGNIEEYLASSQAIENVRMLLAEPRKAWHTVGGFYPGWDGPWRMVHHRDIQGVALYRSDAMAVRYTVTDMGMGLCRYAMRTGDIEYRALPDATPSTGILQRDGRIFACVLRGDSVCLGIEPDDLPTAVVRVLLAAHRVANLPART